MKRSTDRILSTHTGILPRPMDLAAMLEAFDSGETPDRETFQTCVRAAVAEVVRNQVESGVDVVSDGEQGKPGFADYVKDRLTGLVTREGARPRIWRDRAGIPGPRTP